MEPKIDQIYKNAFEAQEIAPPEMAWEVIENELDKSRKSKIFWFYRIASAAVILCILSISGYLFLHQNAMKNISKIVVVQPPSHQKTEAPIAQIENIGNDVSEVNASITTNKVLKKDSELPKYKHQKIVAKVANRITNVEVKQQDRDVENHIRQILPTENPDFERHQITTDYIQVAYQPVQRKDKPDDNEAENWELVSNVKGLVNLVSKIGKGINGLKKGVLTEENDAITLQIGRYKIIKPLN